MHDTKSAMLIKRFSEIGIDHKHQRNVHDRLMFMADHCQNAAIQALIGATGTGKSFALRRFAKAYLAARSKEMAEDPSYRPIAYSLATASGSKAFDWASLYQGGLASLNDPFAACRTSLSRAQRPGLLFQGETVHAAVLRRQLGDAFKTHRTEYFLIDEGHHILHDKTAKCTPTSQYEVLKSLAQTSGVRLLMCGTDALSNGLSNSGQLARRGYLVLLNRYRWGDTDEQTEFLSAVQSILKRMPEIDDYPDVVANAEFFYLYSLGCVGTFKDWADRTYSLALLNRSRSITIDHFKESKLTARQIATINNEIIACEQAHDFNAEPSKDLTAAILSGVSFGTAEEEIVPATPKAPTRRAKRVVGHRAAHRDPVGASK